MRLFFAMMVCGSFVALVGCEGASSPAPKPAPAKEVASKEKDEVAEERAKLSEEDRKLVDAQEWCVISKDERLGSMGAPIKLDVNGQAVFVCCKSCEKRALANAETTLKTLEAHKAKKAEMTK